MDQAEKHRRVSLLTDLSDRKFHEFISSRKGKRASVLWEQPARPGAPMHGFTDNYIRVTAPYRPELINTVSEVMLGDLDPTQSDTLSVII